MKFNFIPLLGMEIFSQENLQMYSRGDSVGLRSKHCCLGTVVTVSCRLFRLGDRHLLQREEQGLQHDLLKKILW